MLFLQEPADIAGNEVIGAELTAHIGAESEDITSNFE